jgi:uncharacterized membrane protein affecting hemolysin expression
MFFKRLHRKLDYIIYLLERIYGKEHIMGATLEQLIEQVQVNTQIEQSAVTLIQGIAEQLAAAKDDPEQIQELVDQLKTSADALAAAVLANTEVVSNPEETPADPETPPAEPETPVEATAEETATPEVNSGQ